MRMGMAQSVPGGRPERRPGQERVGDGAEGRHRGLPPGTGLSDTIAAFTPGSSLGLGAEPAEHAGGASAQFTAGGGEQARLVPEFGRVPGGVRLCDVFC